MDVVQRRSGILIVVLLIVAGGIPLTAELVANRSSLTFLQTITVLETIGTVSLSAFLAYLYTDIRNIQSNQEELMTVQYEPEIKITISSGSQGWPVLLIRNSGFAAALDVNVSIDVGGESRSGSHPYLSTSETIEYPVHSENNPLSVDEILERIRYDPEDDEEGPFSRNIKPLQNELICSVNCRDVKGEYHTFEERFPLEETLTKLEDFRIRTEVDALEGVSEELENISEGLRVQNNDML